MKRGDIVVCVNSHYSLELYKEYKIEHIIFDENGESFILIENKKGSSHYYDSCNFIELQEFLYKKRYEKINNIKNRINKNKNKNKNKLLNILNIFK